MSLDVTIRNDDDFTLNCHPTVPVGCEEQVANAKCSRPSVSYEVQTNIINMWSLSGTCVRACFVLLVRMRTTCTSDTLKCRGFLTPFGHTCATYHHMTMGIFFIVAHTRSSLYRNLILQAWILQVFNRKTLVT